MVCDYIVFSPDLMEIFSLPGQKPFFLGDEAGGFVGRRGGH
jgi:hypothetical protein